MEERKRHSVDQLISLAHWMITYPSLLMLSLMWFIIYSIQYVSDGALLNFALSFLCSLPPVLLFSAIVTNRWRIWAFKITDDVHELERRALEDKIIYPQDSVLRYLEIWTTNSRREWDEINERFTHKKLAQDDKLVPEETSIYFHKKSLIAALTLTIAFILFSTYLTFSATDSSARYFLFFLAFAILLFVAVPLYEKIQNSNAQIVINAKGVKTSKTPFCTWDEISEERAKYYWRHSREYLEFTCPQGSVMIKLRDLKINMKELNHLMKVYRFRYNLQRASPI